MAARSVAGETLAIAAASRTRRTPRSNIALDALEILRYLAVVQRRTTRRRSRVPEYVLAEDRWKAVSEKFENAIEVLRRHFIPRSNSWRYLILPKGHNAGPFVVPPRGEADPRVPWDSPQAAHAALGVLLTWLITGMSTRELARRCHVLMRTVVPRGDTRTRLIRFRRDACQFVFGTSDLEKVFDKFSPLRKKTSKDIAPGDRDLPPAEWWKRHSHLLPPEIERRTSRGVKVRGRELAVGDSNILDSLVYERIKSRHRR